MPNLDHFDSGPALRLFLLGTFRVVVGSHAIDSVKWRRRKASALLKLLALTPAHRLHREKITDILWPAATPAAGANNFHQALHLARRTLDPANANPRRWLRLENDFLCLSPDEPVWTDVEAFELAALEARHQRTPALYRRALDLHGGELLPEDDYADWAMPRRAALHQEYVSLLMGLAETYQGLNELEAAIETLGQVIAAEPQDEPAHRALMAACALAGKRAQALAQYAALRTELEVEPDTASQKLYQQILAGEVRSPGPRTPTPATNLPASLTSIVGREKEMVELQRLLSSARLLTLTGPGGCGKTRLALEVVQAVADRFPNGV